MHEVEPKAAQGNRSTKLNCPRVNRWKKLEPAPEIKVLKTVYPESVNAISSDGQWEEIEVAVDSGATESVTNENTPSNIMTKDGSKKGIEYEVADGHRIPNEGEKRFHAVTEEGVVKLMTLQVADVNQTLLSVSRTNEAGNKVVFDGDASYIENKLTGQKTWLRKKNGMFTIKLWVQRPF